MAAPLCRSDELITTPSNTITEQETNSHPINQSALDQLFVSTPRISVPYKSLQAKLICQSSGSVNSSYDESSDIESSEEEMPKKNIYITSSKVQLSSAELIVSRK